jgi:hypothetical protein
VHTGFWWENGREGDHFEDLGIDELVATKIKKTNMARLQIKNFEKRILVLSQKLVP